VRTEGKLYLFGAIDYTSKFVYGEMLGEYGKVQATQFLRNLLKAHPYKIHTILTDNGVQFTYRKVDKHAFMHIFDRICLEHHIEHRLTKFSHPWINGQVERMNRTTLKRYYYDTHDQLKRNLHNFVNAYNFAKRLKTFKGLTSYEFLIKAWQDEPESFTINPHHYNMGLYI
jgi:transposase InsO family protein